MTPFVRLTAVAAPLPLANVDTDMILPGRFLKTISRQGLGGALFASLRDRPDFVLNRSPWDRAGILVALDNFGCGSSREHAPWALLDFGIRCVIAPGIADIFASNCIKNGILPIVLPVADVNILLALASDPSSTIMTVDLPAQTIEGAGANIRFATDPGRKRQLLEGRDDIDRTLAIACAIDRFERSCRFADSPWDHAGLSDLVPDRIR